MQGKEKEANKPRRTSDHEVGCKKPLEGTSQTKSWLSKDEENE